MALKSPCVDVCVFDGKTGFCVACLRTLPEAREWKKMTDFKRHQIVNERSRRQKKLDKDSPGALGKAIPQGE